MRKSPLSKSSLDSSVKRVRRNRSLTVGIEILKPELTFYNGVKQRLDFTLLYKLGCMGSGDVVLSRKPPIIKYAQWFESALLDKKSHDTLANEFGRFKQYLVWCDHNGLDAMSIQGYRALAGNNGELRRLVALANKPFDYLFMYENGQEKGIKEGTAGSTLASIKSALNRCGVYESNWHSGINVFINDGEPTKKYSGNELETTLRRLQFYFFSLSSQLIEHKKNNPDLPPPDCLVAFVDKADNGRLYEKEVKQVASSSKSSGVTSYETPFNRAMQAAYYLFAYYTSFNTTSILDVRNPIDVITERKEKRTVKYVTVRGFKGRSNKVVSGLFSDFDIDEIPKADGTDAGYITAELDKKDGLVFIKALSDLSTLYSDTPYQNIIYQLNNSFEIQPMGKCLSRIKLSEELGLYADFTDGLTEHFIEAYFLALDKNRRIELSVLQSVGIGHVVSNSSVLFPNPQSRKRFIINVAYAAIRSITSIDLKNIIMPLGYSEIDQDGNVTVTFNYKNDENGSFLIKSKYKRFFESLENYASYYNPTSLSKYNPNNRLKPPYLIPLGQRYQTKQWNGPEPTITGEFLRRLGVSSGQYFINLSAKRFRTTTSNNHFELSDSGYSTSKYILQNTRETFFRSYVDGDSNQNKTITSQAIQTLEEWSNFDDIKQAKLTIKERLNIPVLEYDTWKQLRVPTNPNGVLCGGQPDIAARKQHGESKYLSRKLLDTDHGEISCYQFDMCVYCKSAKLVDDVQSVYKFLSFIELLEDAADRVPDITNKLTEKARYFKRIAEHNISVKVLHEAEDKLFNDGRYFLHDDEFIYSMGE
jgi:hypothetical protein